MRYTLMKRAIEKMSESLPNEIAMTSEQPKKRRWFQLHWTTVILLLLVAGTLLGANTIIAAHQDSFDCDINNNIQFVEGGRQYGWPLVACYTMHRNGQVCVGKVNWVLVYIDCVYNLSFLVITAIVMEWADRRRPWLRWHVITSLMLFGICEVFFWTDWRLEQWAVLTVLPIPIVAGVLMAVYFFSLWKERRK